MKGSVVVGFRLSIAEHEAIKVLADRKGLTVAAFIRGKAQELAAKTVNRGAGPVNNRPDTPHTVNSAGSVNTVPARHCTKEGCVACQLQRKKWPGLFTS